MGRKVGKRQGYNQVVLAPKRTVLEGAKCQGEGCNIGDGSYCEVCEHKVLCKVRASFYIEKLPREVGTPVLYTREEVGGLLTQFVQLELWMKNLRDYAYGQAVSEGMIYPGWKLVEGKSNRKYTNEEQIVNVLRAAGFADEVIFSQAVQSLTSLEKSLGKQKVEELLGNWIVKGQGKPTLVPLTDKRAAIKLKGKGIQVNQ